MNDKSSTGAESSDGTWKTLRTTADIHAHMEAMASEAVRHVGKEFGQTTARCADPRRIARRYPFAAVAGVAVASAWITSRSSGGDCAKNGNGKAAKKKNHDERQSGTLWATLALFARQLVVRKGLQMALANALRGQPDSTHEAETPPAGDEAAAAPAWQEP